MEDKNKENDSKESTLNKIIKKMLIKSVIIEI
jgi:hypothetical protein